MAWACMALGGAVKQIVIVMPAVMMLLDIWPLARTDWDRIWRDGWRLAREKWAFWAIGVGVGVSADLVPSRGRSHAGRPVSAPAGDDPRPLPVLFQKLVWPSGLAVLQGDLPFRWRRSRWVGFLVGDVELVAHPEGSALGAVGWVWFVGTLFPLSGVVWAGAERLATRFLYVPQMGLTLALVLGVARWCGQRRGRILSSVAMVVAVLAAYLGTTLWLLPHWRDSLTLFTRVLQLNPDSVHGFDNLGRAHFEAGRLADWQAYLEDFRATHSRQSIADIQYAWWMAAMIGDVETSWDVLENLTGSDRSDPDFWLWLEGKTNDKMLLGTWRDVAGICLRDRGDLEQMERLRQRWDGVWDERTRVNFLAEMLYACWSAGREAEADILARDAGALSSPLMRAQMPARFIERWQQGARGYAFACFRNYADWVPGDGMALNNMAWLVATAEPDGLRHARMDEWPAAAVDWAERALAASGGTISAVWGTVAAARANAGDFAGAQTAADRALALAEAAGDQALAAKFHPQLEAYRLGRPWRE
jgi:tetratricopeptide (TPR) repeat protein